MALKLLSQALVLERNARFEWLLVPIKHCTVFGRWENPDFGAMLEG
jgi:hypothetical protein